MHRDLSLHIFVSLNLLLASILNFYEIDVVESVMKKNVAEADCCPLTNHSFFVPQ